jgi:predicted nucleic acid-binding protein
MTRYVISADVALRLAAENAVVAAGHKLLAPTLLRSQVLAALYRSVRDGELTERESHHRLDLIRGLRLRLLGDRVLQGTAWKIADGLGWADTYDAEYLALTRLQADAFVTLDPELARVAAGVVPVAPFEELA